MNLHKILVPTDFSPTSVDALHYAADLARAFPDAEILLVHVMEPPVYPAVTFAAPVGPAPVHATLRESASDRLARLASEDVPENIRVRTILADGPAYQALAETAKEEEVDLIVISTHGHTGLKRMLLGSVAERVVRTAPCPVLTVRQHVAAPAAT